MTSTSGALSRTYGYDDAGNTTSFGGITFAYDNRGRMKSSTRNGVTTTYTYNALGQLIKKGTSALYFYDDAGYVLGIYTTSGMFTEEIVWLGDIPLATLRPNTSGGVDIYYIHSDHLNTPRVVTDTGNSMRWRLDADPFGNGAPSENPSGLGTFAFSLRFPGQIYFGAHTPTVVNETNKNQGRVPGQGLHPRSKENRRTSTQHPMVSLLD